MKERFAAWWHWWVTEVTHRPIDPRPFAAVRILASLCLLTDLLRMWQLGLLPFMAVPGVLNKKAGWYYVLDTVMGDAGGFVAWGVSVVALVFVAAGVWTRPMILVAVTAYSQFGHLFTPGDRAIDRMLRMVLLFVLFSGATRVWAVWKAEEPKPMPAWPVDLVRLLIVLVYMGAGFVKIQHTPAWLDPRMEPELYRIMCDPLAGNLDAEFWAPYWPLFWFGSVATIVVEMAAPLALTKWSRYWALVAMWIHLGIAATMYLGMFSYGMLAMYPILFFRMEVTSRARS